MRKATPARPGGNKVHHISRPASAARLEALQWTWAEVGKLERRGVTSTGFQLSYRVRLSDRVIRAQ